MAVSRQEKVACCVLVFLGVCIVLWNTPVHPGQPNVEIVFAGYTNTATRRQALFSLKNTGSYSVLRHESCTITWTDPTGSNHMAFFRLEPKVFEIQEGAKEIVAVPVSGALNYKVNFGFSIPPTMIDVIQERTHWRLRKRDDRLFVFLGPTLTNTSAK
jgi:hypothetical protein